MYERMLLCAGVLLAALCFVNGPHAQEHDLPVPPTYPGEDFVSVQEALLLDPERTHFLKLNMMTGGDLRELAKFSLLRDLHVVGGRNFTDAGLADIRSIPFLQRLTVEGFGPMPLLTREGLANLAGLEDLTHLTLADSHPIDRKAAAAIAQIAQLRSLTLRGVLPKTVDDTDSVIEIIASMALVEFTASGGAITDHAVRHLAGMTHLRHVTLLGTQLTAVGCVRLLESPRLRSVAIRGARLSLIGDVDETFDVGESTVSHVDVSGNRLVAPLVVRAIADLPRLEDANLSDCQTLRGNTFRRLVSGPALVVLRASRAGMHSGDLEAAEYSPSLRVLDLDATALTDEAIRQIVEHCPDLLEFNVSDSRALTNAAVTHLVALGGLRVLNITCPGITADALNDLARITSLYHLRVSQHWSDEHLRELKRHLTETRIDRSWIFDPADLPD